MAKHGAFQGYIEVNGVNLSDHCTEFDAAMTRADIPAHAMGDTSEYGMPGLSQGDVSATFLQDFAADSVDATLSPLYENKTIHSVIWRAASGAVASGNPQYSGNFYTQTYRAIGGAHGAALLALVTFRRAGNITRTIA